MRWIRSGLVAAVAIMGLATALPSHADVAELSAENTVFAWDGKAELPAVAVCDAPGNLHLCAAQDLTTLNAGTVEVTLDAGELDRWEITVYDMNGEFAEAIQQGAEAVEFEAIENGQYLVYVRPVLVTPEGTFEATASLAPIVEAEEPTPEAG